MTELHAAPAEVRVKKRSQSERRRSRFRISERGQASVELALCLPMLLVFMTGITSFGVALNNYQTLTDAVSVGARLLATSRTQTTDPCNLAYVAVTNALPSLVQQGGALTFTTAMFNPLPGGTQLAGSPYTGSTCSSASTSSGAAGNLVQNGSVQLSVTYPCNLIIFGANLIPGCTLHAQITELVQ